MQIDSRTVGCNSG